MKTSDNLQPQLTTGDFIGLGTFLAYSSHTFQESRMGRPEDYTRFLRNFQAMSVENEKPRQVDLRGVMVYPFSNTVGRELEHIVFGHIRFHNKNRRVTGALHHFADYRLGGTLALPTNIRG